jgi:hypothetical protein
LRENDRYFTDFSRICETLKHLRHLVREGDCLISLDMTDG